MPLIDFILYSLVLIGAFAVRSAAGFGAALIAVPALALFLPVSTAVSVATILTVVTSAQQTQRGWHHIAWPQFAIMSLYTALGIGLGFYFIRMCDEATLRKGLGAFLILYSLYALSIGPRRPTPAGRWRKTLAAGTGVAGGFCAALFGSGAGPIYVVYFNSLGLSIDAFRVTMSTILLVSGAARIAGYASYGFYEASTLALVAIGFPLVFAGSWLGDRLVQNLNLNPQRFGWIVGGLVLLSGIALLLR